MFCQEIIFDPPLESIQLNIDADQDIEPVLVEVNIVITNILPSEADDFQLHVNPPGGGGLSDNLRYYHFNRAPGSGSSGDDYEIFQEIPGEPGVYLATAFIPITDDGTWRWRFELNPGREPITGSGGGCLSTNDEAVIDIPINDEQDFSGTDFFGSCLDVDNVENNQSFNHATCRRFASGPFEISPIPEESYCQAGYVPDEESCVGQRFDVGDLTGFSDVSVCIPCIDERQDLMGVATHLQECEVQPTESTPPELICAAQTVASGGVLRCLRATFEPELIGTGLGRCVYANDTGGGSLPSGERCYIYGNECLIQGGIGALERYTCQSGDDGGIAGTCQPSSDVTDREYCDDEDLVGLTQCTEDQGWDDSVECDTSQRRCVLPCDIGHSIPPDSPQCTVTVNPQPEPEPGDDDDDGLAEEIYGLEYGIRNCPRGIDPDNPTQQEIEEYAACFRCISGVNSFSDIFTATGTLLTQGEFYIPGETGVWTALGCIKTSPEGFFTFLVRLALGILGGLILLRMIYLGYLYQTGNEQKIQEAKSGIQSALWAILVVVFSVVALQFIGVNILDVVPTGFFSG